MSSGGIVLNPSFYGTFGHTDTMVHEIGHSLGLYHVFRGISEVESCNDACLETEPSMETGDLCADTNPTPKYKGCHDPEPGNETCGCRDLTHTPFNNYMSYAGEILLTLTVNTCKNWQTDTAVEGFVEHVHNLAGTFLGIQIRLTFKYPTFVLFNGELCKIPIFCVGQASRKPKVFMPFFSTIQPQLPLLLADDACTDSFTLNQVARMQCYLDLIYQTWQPASKPPPVPMAPQVVKQHHNSITIEWFAPISGHFYDRWNELLRLPNSVTYASLIKLLIILLHTKQLRLTK